jgi:hypothetical protein
MLVKMTSRNKLTLPRSVTGPLGPIDYVDIEVRNGQIILTPLPVERGNAVRAKLAKLGLTAADAPKAVDWSRHLESGRRT